MVVRLAKKMRETMKKLASFLVLVSISQSGLAASGDYFCTNEYGNDGRLKIHSPSEVAITLEAYCDKSKPFSVFLSNSASNAKFVCCISK